MEINDIDFFEVIGSKLSEYFCSYLLKIILQAFKENILNQLLCNPKYEIVMQNEFFMNLINKTFETTKFNFVPPVKMKINANKMTIFNGFKIPKSKPYFDLIINYVTNEIIKKKKDNLNDVEQSLRKVWKGEEVEKVRKEYFDKIQRFEENLKNEIEKHEIFKATLFLKLKPYDILFLKIIIVSSDKFENNII